MKQVYLDNAATTPVRLEVEVAMRPYFCEKYGNPSGVYQMSSENRGMIENVREQIAKTLNASAEEIYFTSGGTESDNWAIKAAAQMLKEKGRHIITSKIEHHAILNSCAYLEKQGFEVTYLDVDEWGSIRLDVLEKAIRKDTILISVMYANNEVGTIQKIAQIGKIAEKNDILFHTDAVQAYGQLLIDVKKENIDLLSASAHKFNGPKGVGFLYIRKKILLPEYIHGGKQERDHRAGTENVPGIAGMGKAAEIAFTTREYREKEIQQLRDYLIRRLQRGIPYCRLNGSLTNRLPGNCNISFQFIEGNELLLLLDEKNICASAASACSTGDTSPSHVLTAMGIPEKLARGTLRLTIGYQNTQEEIDYTVQCIKEAVEKLLNERDGLVLGICNGFQALIKLGLVPYGKIATQLSDSPTLTTNSIGRHVSKTVYTKVVTNKSPWLQEAELGGVYSIPASHGEGRFVANDEWLKKLKENGQIATEYVPVDETGYEGEFNVNGSYMNIEGITSPDGRVLGKMAHSERRDAGVAVNIYGEQDIKIFESGVEYFR